MLDETPQKERELGMLRNSKLVGFVMSIVTMLSLLTMNVFAEGEVQQQVQQASENYQANMTLYSTIVFVVVIVAGILVAVLTMASRKRKQSEQ